MFSTRTRIAARSAFTGTSIVVHDLQSQLLHQPPPSWSAHAHHRALQLTGRGAGKEVPLVEMLPPGMEREGISWKEAARGSLSSFTGSLSSLGATLLLQRRELCPRHRSVMARQPRKEGLSAEPRQHFGEREQIG